MVDCWVGRTFKCMRVGQVVEGGVVVGLAWWSETR